MVYPFFFFEKRGDNYLRGDLRKSILTYSFGKESYAKRDTEIVDTWLDAVRNLRNYCAHNSMLVGMTSSVVLLDLNDDVNLLQADNDLFSRIYALKKLIPSEDVNNMKNDIKKLIQRTPVNIFLLEIMPSNWEEIYDKILEF
jgi:abortive infection bacteriophage resistance protein